MITLEQLRSFTTAANQELCDALNAAMLEYSILDESQVKRRRIRYFMAQCAAETQNFTKWEESLYYTTPARIVAVWPSRFYVGTPVAGKQNAADFVKNELKLAEAVYGGRMGNNEPGDGLKYKGRGAGHLTGKAAYEKYSKQLFNDMRLVESPAQVAEYKIGCLTFAAFWRDNGLNELADRDEFTKCTQRINGASGQRLADVVSDRLPYLKRANSIF
ncbi:endolysin [Achromobacter phage Motura]|uniref:Endolysin n=1 Tax=Achromobacter phage Motura TaxID=2591403 RepID=A0A514CTD2_9CAUD|nr:endolysin [Achromobacter phage Motura]QDH83710.1 endolysin [Achromobacter phage Motura]